MSLYVDYECPLCIKKGLGLHPLIYILKESNEAQCYFGHNINKKQLTILTLTYKLSKSNRNIPYISRYDRYDLQEM